MDTSHEARFAEAWRSHRSYLVDVAFGMLGQIAAAEDAVQEAFSRLANADIDQIEEVRGWLIVVTSRICLDQIRAAASRHEEPHDTATIEFAGQSTATAAAPGRPTAAAAATSPQPPDPADRVTLDDEVRLALLVVLQRLSPIERVVFVLHDIFRMPFDAIAETVGRPAPTCRQLARRARLKVEAKDARAGQPRSGGPPAAVAVDAAEHQLVVEQFIRSCANGDLAGLVEILDPAVWGDVDLGPLDRRSGQVRRGATAVATNVLRFLRGMTMVSNPIGPHTIVLVFVEQKLHAIVLLTVARRLVRQIHVLADPEKLLALDAQLTGSHSAGSD